MIAAEAILSGSITFGPGCVVHPKARIIARRPIVFGTDCVIEETATVLNSYARGGTHHLWTDSRGPETLVVGDGNWFHAGCCMLVRLFFD